MVSYGASQEEKARRDPGPFGAVLIFHGSRAPRLQISSRTISH